MTSTLLYRFIILNAAMAGMLWVLYSNGVTQQLADRDTLHLVKGILAFFVLAYLGTWRAMWHANKDDVVSQMDACEQAGWLNQSSNWLASLGLLGTIIGFGIALSGIDPDALTSAAGTQAAVGKMIEGMRIALDTTLVGAALGLWIEFNMRLINTATGRH